MLETPSPSPSPTPTGDKKQRPWESEPDRVEFESSGFPCLIVRHPRLKHLCGYVAVPPGHPWHGQDLSMAHDLPSYPNVHGGITYAAKCEGEVCHVAKPGEPDDVWWLGFDAAHSGDCSPNDVERYGTRNHESYKTVEYMKAECESLARQAKAVSL